MPILLFIDNLNAAWPLLFIGIIIVVIIGVGALFKFRKDVMILLVILAVFFYPKESANTAAIPGRLNKECRCLGVEVDTSGPFMGTASCFGIPYFCENPSD